MSKQCDVLIIGGGHNGLVAAAYLARTGLQVTVLERRAVLGGACVTEEPWPGYRVSTLSYLCSLLQPRIIEELELKRFGYHIYPKDPSFFTAFPDGRHIFFWQDMQKTVAEMAKFSRRDAELYPQYEEELAQLAEGAGQRLGAHPEHAGQQLVLDAQRPIALPEFAHARVLACSPAQTVLPRPLGAGRRPAAYRPPVWPGHRHAQPQTAGHYR